MRLAAFILANREPILREWEAFARTCAPASGTMDVRALRDHADQMLTVIAADLDTAQSQVEQAEKSRGLGVEGDPHAETPAGQHGAGRAQSGFSVEQMVAEYRALRASVIRLWSAQEGEFAPIDLQDLTRFNEAIDQALAESVAEYNQDLEQSKEIFLAILGHDLRTPLSAISTSARFMLELEDVSEPQRVLARRISTSTDRTLAMVGDLLDFTRGRLGGGIPIGPTRVSLGQVLREVIAEMQAAQPGTRIVMEGDGDEVGVWDQARLSQALTNLIGNALQHGTAGSAVSVALRAENEQVVVAIHNHGSTIDSAQLDGIFNPMKAREKPASAMSLGPTGSLGLGLFIAERIIGAHGGRIDVSSSDGSGTTFAVRLPRDSRQPGAGTERAEPR